MRWIVPGIAHLHRVRISNVYLIEGEGGRRWLVDTGHRVERRDLLAELRGAGLAPGDIAGALITHRHSDHAGNARYLQREHGVAIAAHRADAEVLAGARPRPSLARGDGSRVAGLLARIENRFPAAPCEVDLVLEDGGAVDGIEVHSVPGHTPGSVFYRHPESGALATGDMVLTAQPPLVVRAGISFPYPSFTDDAKQAMNSIRSFHERGPAYRHLLPGHGKPLLFGAKEQVQAALREALR